MCTMVSQITSLTIVYSTVYSGADQRKQHQTSTSLAFVRGIHRWSVNCPHKWPVTRKMLPFVDVIMLYPVKMGSDCKQHKCNLILYELILQHLSFFIWLVWAVSENNNFLCDTALDWVSGVLMKTSNYLHHRVGVTHYWYMINASNGCVSDGVRYSTISPHRLWSSAWRQLKRHWTTDITFSNTNNTAYQILLYIHS